MVKINQQPKSRLSPIKFFVCKKYAEDAIKELDPDLEGEAHWLKSGAWTNWYVKLAYGGYLRESGGVY